MSKSSNGIMFGSDIKPRKIEKVTFAEALYFANQLLEWSIKL